MDKEFAEFVFNEIDEWLTDNRGLVKFDNCDTEGKIILLTDAVPSDVKYLVDLYNSGMTMEEYKKQQENFDFEHSTWVA